MSENYSAPFWIPQVNPPLDGEAVSSSVASRSISQLAKRDAYLFGQIENLNQTGGRLVASRAVLDSGVSTGQLVYWNDSSKCFSLALAQIGFNSDGELKNFDSSFAAGLVLSSSGGTGDVLLYGAIDPSVALPGTNLEYLLDYASTQGSFTSGVYYLSRKTAGKITSTPSMPRVQLGYFSNNLIIFTPRYDGYPSGHVHYSFKLEARPAASQNFARTGFSTVQDSNGNPYSVVDYYNAGSQTSLPAVAVAIRKNSNTSPGYDQRVELSSGLDGNLAVNIFSGGGLDYYNPQSAGDSSSSVSLPWPAYGTYISIPGTNLDVAFFKHSDSYSGNTVRQDWPTDSGAKYKIYLPNDFGGWTNSNPYDIDLFSPLNNQYRFRYVIESNTQLASAWPPTPLSSCRVEYGTGENNSLAAILPTVRSLYWDPIGTNGLPWNIQYTVATATQFDGRPDQMLYFIPTSPENYSQLVTSLVSRSPSILVERCPDGSAASTGDLQILLDLALGVNTSVLSGYDTAFASVNGETFSPTPIVSELVAGPGINIQRVDSASSNALLPTRNVGKLRISRQDVSLEGEVSSIALRNAKEVFRENLAYVSFIQPGRAASAISARFKVPESGTPAAASRLLLSGMFLGSASVARPQGTNISYNAVFKAVYQVIRPGFDLNALDESRAIAVQYWVIPFSTPYTQLNVLPQAYPGPVSSDFIISSSSINPINPIMSTESPGFFDNDVVTVYISREIENEDASIVDNYPGDLGLVSLRWKITSTI
jgi:hypothetical protein